MWSDGPPTVERGWVRGKSAWNSLSLSSLSAMSSEHHMKIVGGKKTEQDFACLQQTFTSFFFVPQAVLFLLFSLNGLNPHEMRLWYWQTEHVWSLDIAQEECAEQRCSVIISSQCHSAAHTLLPLTALLSDQFSLLVPSLILTYSQHSHPFSKKKIPSLGFLLSAQSPPIRLSICLLWPACFMSIVMVFQRDTPPHLHLQLDRRGSSCLHFYYM